MIRQQHSPTPTPHQCCSAAEKKTGPSSALKSNIELGGGGVKVCYFPAGVFFKVDWHICAKFALLLRRFVHDCSLQ